MESAFCTDHPACSSSQSMFTRASCSGVMLLQRTTPLPPTIHQSLAEEVQSKSRIGYHRAHGFGQPCGHHDAGGRQLLQVPDESLFSIAPRFSSTSSGPSQARARTALPAGWCGATSCHRGAWHSSTIGPPSLSLRVGSGCQVNLPYWHLLGESKGVCRHPATRYNRLAPESGQGREHLVHGGRSRAEPGLDGPDVHAPADPYALPLAGKAGQRLVDSRSAP